jgi:hypothetical protein
MSRPRNNQRPLPRDRLFQKMSEVISLREKVAQAELAARALNPPPEREEMTEPRDNVIWHTH